jgi:hypothetical protein
MNIDLTNQNIYLPNPNIDNSKFDNEINILTHDINNAITINNIMNIKTTVSNNINSHMAHIEKLKKIIEIIENKLEKECKHEWKRDYTYYGEHSQYQCSICKLYK